LLSFQITAFYGTHERRDMEDNEKAWLWFWTIAIIVLLVFFFVWLKVRDTVPSPYATPPTYKIGADETDVTSQDEPESMQTDSESMQNHVDTKTIQGK